jgi:hypothetical protein
MQSLGFVKHACSCYGFVRFRDVEAHKNLHRYLGYWESLELPLIHADSENG